MDDLARAWTCRPFFFFLDQRVKHCHGKMEQEIENERAVEEENKQARTASVSGSSAGGSKSGEERLLFIELQ